MILSVMTVISFSVCNLLAFSSASLLASFSFNCLSVSVAIFLSCNTSFKSHFIACLGVSSLTILSISISSSSGTFCLCFLSPVLGFIYSIFAKHLLAYSALLAFCLCFCPLVLYCMIFVLANLSSHVNPCRYYLRHYVYHLIVVSCFLPIVYFSSILAIIILHTCFKITLCFILYF